MPCEVCGKTYVWNADENIDAKPHVCKTCGLSFSLKIQLKRHGEIHTNGEPYVCITCTANPSQAESKSYNLRLTKKSDNHTCDVCGASFNSKRLLVIHSMEEHCFANSDASNETDSDDYEKPKKKRRSNNLKNKSKGVGFKKKNHPESKQLVCPHCCKGFAYQASYDKHVNGGKCLTEKTSLNLSKGSKKSKKVAVPTSDKHECEVCGKSFTRKSSLEGHMLHHAQEESDDSPDEKGFYDSFAEESDDYVSQPLKPKSPKIQVIRKSYTCDKCNFVCFSKPTYEKHHKVHEREDLISEVMDVAAGNSQPSAFYPSSTSKEKPSEEKVKETFLCEICDKVFVTKGRLKKHLLFHVTTELEEGDQELKIPEKAGRGRPKRSKDFGCDVCGREFAGLTCLNKHIAKRHKDQPTDLDPSDPDFSKRSKQSKSSSARKKKWSPSMECEYCHEVIEGKRSVYMKHLHTHTPEVCGICDERFVDRPSLREHCKVHIGTEEGRMFVECSQKALEAKLGIMPPEPKVEYIYLMVR